MGETHADEGLRNKLIQCPASADAQAIDPPFQTFPDPRDTLRQGSAQLKILAIQGEFPLRVS
jgi:hypothetical protein